MKSAGDDDPFSDYITARLKHLIFPPSVPPLSPPWPRNPAPLSLVCPPRPPARRPPIAHHPPPRWPQHLLPRPCVLSRPSPRRTPRFCTSTVPRTAVLDTGLSLFIPVSPDHRQVLRRPSHYVSLSSPFRRFSRHATNSSLIPSSPHHAPATSVQNSHKFYRNHRWNTVKST
jgi:hypothetical protein